jgi:hypothetical protein
VLFRGLVLFHPIGLRFSQLLQLIRGAQLIGGEANVA